MEMSNSVTNPFEEITQNVSLYYGFDLLDMAYTARSQTPGNTQQRKHI